MEYIKRKLLALAGLIALIFFMWLVISGHRTVGYSGLMMMASGLAGILGLLYVYNKQYNK